MTNNKFELTWYEKDDDNWLGSIPIRNIQINELKSALELPSEENLQYIYPVSDKDLSTIQNLVDTTIKLDQYDYFIEPL